MKKKLLASALFAGAALVPAASVYAAAPTGTVTLIDAAQGIYEFNFYSSAMGGFAWVGSDPVGVNPQMTCITHPVDGVNCNVSVGNQTGPFVFAGPVNAIKIADNHGRGWVQKINKTKRAQVRFGYIEQVSNTGNNAIDYVTSFIDPALLDVKVRYNRRTLEASGGILPGESRLTITNGDLLGGSGLEKIGIWINGKPVFNVAQGADAAHRLQLTGTAEPLVFDIGKFISATGESTIIVEGIGDKDSTANIVVGPPSLSVTLP